MPCHRAAGRLVPAVLGLGLELCAATAFAQIPPGLAMTKTCPPVEQPGALFTCTFTIQNGDPVNAVNNLAVTNTVPFPGGTPVAVPCLYLGNPVTTLQPFGTAGDTCSGSVEETAHDCSIVLVDLITANGTATDGHPVSGAVSAGVNITDCPPPTPTNTPTVTPTNTPTIAPTSTPASSPTSTRTNTPTVTSVPIVPTLSFPILATLGLALTVVALLLMRKSA